MYNVNNINMSIKVASMVQTVTLEFQSPTAATSVWSYMIDMKHKEETKNPGRVHNVMLKPQNSTIA